MVCSIRLDKTEKNVDLDLNLNKSKRKVSSMRPSSSKSHKANKQKHCDYFKTELPYCKGLMTAVNGFENLNCKITMHTFKMKKKNEVKSCLDR